MKFQVVIDVENAAFDGQSRGGELARILRKLAEKLADAPNGNIAGRLDDVNGNEVGRYGYIR